ncbi:unnamed protein product, partial [Candidula unifasciata]
MSPNKMQLCTLCGFVLLTLKPFQTFGFNIQTRNVIAIAGPRGSHFGLTASFLPVDSETDTLGMIVGAPNANTTQGGVNSGTLHLCENILDASEKCSILRHYDDNVR